MARLVLTRFFLLVALATIAKAQFGYYNSYFPYQPANFFRQQNDQFPQKAIEGLPQEPQDPRSWFNTATVTVATTTSTTTIVTTTTCTTSTSSLKVCSPSGRRRRGMALTGDKKGRGLFYNEEDHENQDGSGIFLPQTK